MIDLTELQKSCNKIAKAFKYKTDKKSTYKHLKKELREWWKAKPVDPHLIEVAINIECDNTLKMYWDQFLKGTEADEIPDMPFILKSFAYDRVYDIESLYMLKHRINKIRLNKR